MTNANFGFRALILGGLALAPASALAGPCDALAAKASSAKGDALIAAYKDLAKCDAKAAEEAYGSFMKASGDVGTLSALSLAAIDAKLYTPVWKMMEQIPDYSARDEVARAVGAQCAAHADVLPFLQGAYFGLRSLQFAPWGHALASCESEGLSKWLEDTIRKPPASAYDEKFNTLLTAEVRRKRGDALPVLEAAAKAAGEGGPFASILDAMSASVEPDMGEDMSDADRKRLETSLIAVAGAVGPAQAALVADRLFGAGSEAAAASLLPRVYPDRVQPDGRLLYGVAAAEVCDKEAVIHWATVSDPAKRWLVVADAEAAARAAFKPRLKCAATEPWTVLVSAEPAAKASDLQPWLDEQVAQQTGKGIKAEIREEKPIVLP